MLGISGNRCSLDDLPAGFMGKMLVYKSGAIKMKLGDAIFDVSTPPTLRQQAIFFVSMVKSTGESMVKGAGEEPGQWVILAGCLRGLWIRAFPCINPDPWISPIQSSELDDLR